MEDNNIGRIPAEGKQEGDGNGINIKWLIATVLGVWPWFLVSIIVAISIGQLYLRYATPTYHIGAEIMINEGKKGGGGGAESKILEGLGMGSGGSIDNEMRILKSRTLMKQVVRALNLNVKYTLAGRLKTAEVYKDRPFDLFAIDVADSSEVYGGFLLSKINERGYSLMDNGKAISGLWGDTIMSSIGRIVLYKRTAQKGEGEYRINVMPLTSAASLYMSRLNVAIVNKAGSSVSISYTDTRPNRGVDVVDMLIEQYMTTNINDRNRIANNTIEFIDDRLRFVVGELTGIEKDIEGFKKSNQITDVETQSSMLVSSSKQYNEELYKKEIEFDLLKSLESYVRSNRNVPGTIVITNTRVAGPLQRYNELVSQKLKYNITSTDDFPYVQSINKQMEMAKNDLLESVVSVKSDLQYEISKLRERSNYYEGMITEIPQKQRVFLEYSRQQNIKQALYLFLLQKREETAISKSSTVANAKVVDPAMMTGIISPDNSRINYISILIGLLVPALIIYIRRLANNRIINKVDIAKQTSAPVLAEIGHYDEDSAIAVKDNSKSILSEQFRGLRTNLQFLLTEHKDKCILLTSSMSGEGKSFIAINLASTFAISGKKVVLMELDLRKPKITVNLGLENSIGFSSYAIGQAEINEIIRPSGVNDNLSIISSGPVPPNPAELIMLPRIDTLFEYLRNNFDYIIIDTAPLGLVTDAQLIGKFADASLFIVRQGYTFKTQIAIPNDVYVKNRLPKMSIIVNDVRMNRGLMYGYGGYGGYGYGGYGYGGYGYGGYGYGTYGNGYFQEENKTGLKKFFKKIRK